jgi:hypothetical protein
VETVQWDVCNIRLQADRSSFLIGMKKALIVNSIFVKDEQEVQIISFVVSFGALGPSATWDLTPVGAVHVAADLKRLLFISM